MICVKNHGNPSYDWFLSLGLSTWLSPGFNNHVFSRRLYHSSLTQFDSVELKFVASEMLRRQNETKEVGALTSPQNSQDWYESTCAVGRAVWNEVMEIRDNRTSGIWVRVHGSVAITTFKCRWDSFLQLCHLCSQPFAHNVNDLTSKAFEDEIKKEKPHQWINENRFINKNIFKFELIIIIIMI